MLNLAQLNNIKLAEDHQLEILIADESSKISVANLLTFKPFGKVTVAVNTQMEASILIAKLANVGYSIVTLNRIPMKRYDVLIGLSFTTVVSKLISALKTKYLMLNDFTGFSLPNYYEFAKGVWKFSAAERPTLEKITNVKKQETSNEILEKELDRKFTSFIESLAPYDAGYDKHKINYLHEQVPGKVSIIMVISKNNNKFANTLRDLRAQDVPSVEFIIIDNNVGYRNNVKPNIKYGETMPLDFCQYHARELTTGEYLIFIDEDSDVFDIMSVVSQGKYEIR